MDPAPRRWFQVSIRELFLVLLIAGVAGGWWHDRHRDDPDQRLLAPIIECLGAVRSGESHHVEGGSSDADVDLHWWIDPQPNARSKRR